MRRTVLLAVCVLGLALTGCSGPSDSPAPDVTAVDPPRITTEQPTAEHTVPNEAPESTARQNATFEGVEMPPGTDSRGLLDRSALLAGTREALRSTDLTLVHNRTDRVLDNGTVRDVTWRNSTWAYSTDGRSRFSVRVSAAGTEAARSIETSYTVDGTSYLRRVVDGETEYFTREGDAGAYASFLPSVLVPPAGDWQPTTTTTVDGSAAVVFEPVANSSVAGRLVIDSRGFVHEARYRYERQGDDGVRYLTTESFELEPTASIDAPSWLEEARNASQNSGGELGDRRVPDR